VLYYLYLIVLKIKNKKKNTMNFCQTIKPFLLFYNNNNNNNNNNKRKKSDLVFYIKINYFVLPSIPNQNN